MRPSLACTSALLYFSYDRRYLSGMIDWSWCEHIPTGPGQVPAPFHRCWVLALPGHRWVPIASHAWILLPEVHTFPTPPPQGRGPCASPEAAPPEAAARNPCFPLAQVALTHLVGFGPSICAQRQPAMLGPSTTARQQRWRVLNGGLVAFRSLQWIQLPTLDTKEGSFKPASAWLTPVRST